MVHFRGMDDVPNECFCGHLLETQNGKTSPGLGFDIGSVQKMGSII